jgi:hypothetical protein
LKKVPSKQDTAFYSWDLTETINMSMSTHALQLI